MKCWPVFFCALLGLTATAASDTRTPAEKTVQRDEEDEEASSNFASSWHSSELH